MMRVLEVESLAVGGGGIFANAVPVHIELGPGCIVEAMWIEAPLAEAVGTFGKAEFKAEDMIITVDHAPGYKHFCGLRLRLPAHCTITNGRVNLVYDDGKDPR